VVQFLVSLDLLVVNVALPQIATALEFEGGDPPLGTAPR
jgi:hypothetical protein